MIKYNMLSVHNGYILLYIIMHLIMLLYKFNTLRVAVVSGVQFFRVVFRRPRGGEK